MKTCVVSLSGYSVGGATQVQSTEARTWTSIVIEILNISQTVLTKILEDSVIVDSFLQTSTR